MRIKKGIREVVYSVGISEDESELMVKRLLDLFKSWVRELVSEKESFWAYLSPSPSDVMNVALMNARIEGRNSLREEILRRIKE